MSDVLLESRKPAAISFTFSNLIEFLTVLSPFLLTFFMIMLSIVNNSIIKGLLYLMGLVIVSYITYLLKSILKEKQDPLASPICNILPFPFITSGTVGNEEVVFSSPLLNSTILGYIMSYLIFPMHINNNVNSPLLIFLVAIFLTNGMVEYWKKCGSIGSIVLGGIVGITLGILYYGIIAASGNKDLAYFSEIKSNAEGCKKPTDQKFKCVTYKRGDRPIGI
tara:strand:+ start:5010 stop:5675 length:666 start_codon:yes stop_codon:yes gene_type:complete